jgi:HD-GYP domain-containing protein (c-di-GMP phosphodiesterase class II)
VPDEIINKPGKLTDAEFDDRSSAIPLDGQEMLERVGGVLAEVGIIVRHHHERWDGGGYPDRIAGDAIPLAPASSASCDAYSAMTTNRPYRAAHAVADAVAELERCAVEQFDPDVSSALMQTVAEHPEHRPARTLLELAA